MTTFECDKNDLIIPKDDLVIPRTGFKDDLIIPDETKK